ncbi:proteasome activator complex subunit 4A-like [Ischnura elegans]|uniref:proteasome activator complex subunit 4A-like n=1 Tax=Ischnura elegans TaxID=197161 RepID=UPI001ED8945F|nr:proteasome activator complex subunit 4A-like [Ischnura elegans]XP_046402716.1 proteasome activator complex subunit 4A-like [Ischnura elegans]
MEELDDNADSNSTRNLGFKPQKELIYNKLLPYADKLDEESNCMFAEIKANLGKCVMQREIQPGCGIWCTQLAKYTKLYGMKFSKEDHIILIKLMYELVTIPDLEPWMLNKFAQVLIILLKKRHLLSPEDLVLEWRPLYNVCKRILNTRDTTLGIIRYFTTLDSTLDGMVHAAKLYFPPEATQEMLDEWRPLLCPYDSRLCHTMTYLEWFLPVTLPPSKAHLGYKLWFEEMMMFWEVCHNGTQWEGDIMWIMARLASSNIGYIDWEPYIPLMFSRFMHSLSLPVFYKQTPSTKHHKLDMSAICLWIVSVLGGKSSAQTYLDQFLKALTSYFHPANFGRWLGKLKELLRKLPSYFIQRLHTERYKQPSWENQIPESHLLTEEDITRFVESVKSVALQAMFCKVGANEVSSAFQHLASLRPKIILPLVLNRLYSTLDRPTEPHRLTAAIHCLVSVVRPLVTGGQRVRGRGEAPGEVERWSFPEGPTHIVPLLNSVLPGIDPNDIRKCFVTMEFISVFATMVPFVDCSTAGEYWKDLTPDEETLCLATAEFEDFILQFMDRCFALIDSSAMETTRLERESDKRSKQENMAEGALESICSIVLVQTSPAIFKAALSKLHSFLTGRILETKVAGRFAATLCLAFAKVNAKETLKVLLPYLCRTIMSLTESDDVYREEILDNELLFNMLLLTEVVNCHGNALVPYIPQLMEVLDRTLKLKNCKEAYQMAGLTLRHILSALSHILPDDLRSVPYSYEEPISKRLPIRDWGKPGNIHRLNISWHVPTDEEFEYAQKLVCHYLPPELEKLKKYSKDEVVLTREELQCSTNTILNLLGCGPFLPCWNEPPVDLVKSCVPTGFVHTKTVTEIKPREVTMPDGSNVRKSIAETVVMLQEKLLRSAEDDTKSLFNLITIYENLLLGRFKTRSDIDIEWKGFRSEKKVLEERLVRGKRHPRALLVERALLQHEARVQSACSSSSPLTYTHQCLMLNLLNLATSHYSEVRCRAQSVLATSLQYFSYSYTIIMPELLKILKEDSNVNHERFKGALYVLLGPKLQPLLTKHNWEMIIELWPTIIQMQPSEKLSVVKLVDSIEDTMHKHFLTITIELEIPDSCVEAAKKLWEYAPLPLDAKPGTDIVQAAKQELELRGKKNLELYFGVIGKLLDIIENTNLHWRYHSLAVNFLRDLVHPSVSYPARAVKFFLSLLIHDSIELRKVAIRAVVFCLRQAKRKHTKVVVNPMNFVEKNAKKVEGDAVVWPGDRPDNEWVQYGSGWSLKGEARRRIPTSSSEWDSTAFAHKTYSGFYCWPKELKVYAPYSSQPNLDRSEEEMTPEEREIYKFFTCKENVDKLVDYLSLEEKKGKDKFNGLRFIMFKGLFRNHGYSVLELFKPHLVRLVAEKQESNQRCAAEIIAGLARGSKHWPFEKVVSLWEFLGPVIRTALTNLTVESNGDWGVCFATALESRDPNRLHWLLEILMEDPLREDASFLDCGRLYTLQGALNQQQWRVAELFHRLLIYLYPYLTHPFQNVRERLGSMLTNIFQPDVVFGKGNRTRSPHIEDFVSEVMPKLTLLNDVIVEHSAMPRTANHFSQKSPSELASEVTECSVGVVGETTHMLKKVRVSNKNGNSSPKDPEKEAAIRLLKTVCKWITGCSNRAVYGARSEFYFFFPLICQMESYDVDEDLVATCTVTLAHLSHSLILPAMVPVALSSIRQVAQCSSWWARSTVLDYLQVLVFHNMATVMSEDSWVQEVTNLVLEPLEDERVEVREKAAQVLGGLLHCGFVASKENLLEEFKKKCTTKVVRSHKQEGVTGSKESAEKAASAMIVRHSGILGLCAFVNAHPYDVPEFLPDIFLILGDHLSDPQPIPSTIRKTLCDFKRTHQDNWLEHQEKFSEEQLTVLTEMIVPPSYYA